MEHIKKTIILGKYIFWGNMFIYMRKSGDVLLEGVDWRGGNSGCICKVIVIR